MGLRRAVGPGNESVSEATTWERLDLGPLSRHTKRGRGRGLSISSTQDIDAGGLISAASLLFAPGERPGRDAISALVGARAGFTVSFDPANEADPEEQVDDASDAGEWIELLANGLTFDLVGLAPGPPPDLPPQGQAFGLAAGAETGWLEAITLRPGPHLAAGARMVPVVRSLAWLAARLTDLPGTRAVAWHAARSWCDPALYRDSVLRWIDGGVFPGLGLASLAPMPDGGMQSQGLALFHGQELRLEPELVDDRAAAAKTALRLMHWLVEHGRVDGQERLTGSDGRPLRLEPSRNGRFVRVWRG